VEVFLQFGFGMMQHCRHLITEWSGGTVVLSPRDLSDKQLRSLSNEVTGVQDGEVLLDPQFYLPHSDHERLCSHAYWPSSYDTGTFFQGAAIRDLLQKLVTLNRDIGAREIVLPGLLASTVDDAWLEVQRSIAEGARAVAGDKPLISTIALDADTARNADHISAILEAAPRWGVEGYYIVCEHPKGDYLVKDPIWLANVLDLTAGLRLAGGKVILGYCNHQMLSAGLVRATAICSGTWMNVRSFPPDKFRTSYDEEVRQRATWYYCPHALSEYKIPFLDIAMRQGVLQLMRPDPSIDGGYARHLFEGPQPSTVGFNEQQAFRHYLHSLHGQVSALNEPTYDEARAVQDALLDRAEGLLRMLSTAGVRGQQRDFAESIDVNRSAISLIDSLRGPMLRRHWTSLA